MKNGFLLALLAYASFSWGDATIKSLRGAASVFEIGFFTTLFAGIVIFFTKPAEERWYGFWRMAHPWRVQARALCGILAGLLGIYAFTTIPFAEAYALIFLSPLLVTVLSGLVLKESIGAWRWLAVAAGLLGVAMVVKPGFRALELGHLAAFGVAFFAATTVVLLRSLADKEKRTSIFGTLVCYGLVFNGAVAASGFVWPGWGIMAFMALAGICTAAGQTLLFLALRLTPASQIAPAHYSQIVWAVVLGALFFREYPDAVAMAGLVVITLAGLLTMLRERIRLGQVRWNPRHRNRL